LLWIALGLANWLQIDVFSRDADVKIDTLLVAFDVINIDEESLA
jgi:hypothetical protein